MTYYLERTIVEGGDNLARLVESFGSQPSMDNPLFTRRIDVRRQITPPDKYFILPGIVAAVDIEVIRTRARVIDSDARVDISAVSGQVSYENILTGQKFVTDLFGLPLGGKRVEVGKFYFVYHSLRYFYVDAIAGDAVTMYLVESFQNGQLIQGEFVQKIEHSIFYIPLTDKKIIKRLEQRLHRLKS